MDYLDQSIFEYRVSLQRDGSHILILINRETNEVVDRSCALTAIEAMNRLALYLKTGYTHHDTMEIQLDKEAA